MAATLIARLIPALGLALGLTASLATAHQLRVFAWVDGDEVVVETRFGGGSAPRAGQVEVFDADDRPVATAPLDENGRARFPLGGHEDGLRIEVVIDDAHDGWWALTPEDIARGRAR